MYPKADEWESISLKKGDIVWDGSPGPSEFYTTEETIKDCGKDAQKIFEKLQVGTTVHWGTGGATQYFIPNFKGVLVPIEKIQLINTTPKPEYMIDAVRKILGLY